MKETVGFVAMLPGGSAEGIVSFFNNQSDAGPHDGDAGMAFFTELIESEEADEPMHEYVQGIADSLSSS